MSGITVLTGHALEMLRTLPDESVNCIVTSPPYYGLRDYGVDGQIGLEKTPAEYLARMVEVFSEVRRVLRKDGTCWVNMGDSYAGNGAAYGDAKSTLQGTKQSGTVAGDNYKVRTFLYRCKDGSVRELSHLIAGPQ